MTERLHWNCGKRLDRGDMRQLSVTGDKLRLVNNTKKAKRADIGTGVLQFFVNTATVYFLNKPKIKHCNFKNYLD